MNGVLLVGAWADILLRPESGACQYFSAMELPRGNHSEYILGTFGHSQESDPDPLPHNGFGWLPCF